MFRPTGLSKKKLDALDAEREVAEKAEIAARDDARKGAYQGKMRMEGLMQDLQRPTQLGAAKGSRSRREEFKFEDDDGEQEANNEEIDNQIDQISAGVSMLHGAARAINTELEYQTVMAGNLAEKVRVPRHPPPRPGYAVTDTLKERHRQHSGSEKPRPAPTSSSHDQIGGLIGRRKTSGSFACLAGWSRGRVLHFFSLHFSSRGSWSDPSLLGRVA